MKQLFYSEDLKKYFDTEEECIKAEKENEDKLALIKKEKEERALEAKNVEDLYKKANEAYKEANEALSDFCKKYGSYHTTIKNAPATSMFDLMDMMFDRFF